MSRSFRVVVMAGGDSAEREVSIQSGKNVAHALRQAGHRVTVVDPAETKLDDVDFQQVDVCFLALHGGAGEDGRVQSFLDERNVAYTGSGPTASRAGMSKALSKELFRIAGVPTPDYLLVEPHESAGDVAGKVASLGFPSVFKPDMGGSSLGVAIAREENDIEACLAQSRQFGALAIAERYVCGREMTVSVLGRRALPLLEVAGIGDVFDYRSKYSGTTTEYRFQTDLAPIKVEQLQRTAIDAAAALATAGLVRVDILLDDLQRPWVLEVNTLPGMTDTSMAPRAAAEVGMDMPALCNWMLEDALDVA